MHIHTKADFSNSTLSVDVEVVPADEAEHNRLAEFISKASFTVKPTTEGDKLSFNLSGYIPKPRIKVSPPQPVAPVENAKPN